jgi:N-dimethylarginine dimethylaminohydrolase
MAALWGDWYCDSEIAPLRAVLMRRPGPEIELVTEENYASYRWKAPMDPERARRQHDALADIYREHGVTVHYVQEQRPDRPNALFMRDLVFMTPEGAIVCRPAIPARRGEERYAAAALGELGVPVLKTINGFGYFEGACAMWVDRTTVIIGTGSRANHEGAAQVEAELKNIGVTDILRFQIPFGHAHLDGLMNIPDTKTVVIFPWQVPYDVVSALSERGFRILEATDLLEIKTKAAINFVAVEPGRVVMPAGCPNTRAMLVDAGVSVIEAEIDELLRGWGAVHCMTAFLRRDPHSGVLN